MLASQFVDAAIGRMNRPMQNAYKLLALSAVAVLLFSGIATAQQPNPSRTSPPAAAAPQGAPPQIEVPQSTTATYANWVVQCQSVAGPPPKKVCDMAQVTQAQGSSAPFSRVAVAQPVKGQVGKLIVLLPVNVSFAANVRIQTGDADPGIAAPFARCIPGGCIAEFDLKDDVLKKFRASSAAGKLTFSDAGGHDVSVPISFNGFAQAFDALARE
jgi:invasion protein IalB